MGALENIIHCFERYGNDVFPDTCASYKERAPEMKDDADEID